VHFPAAGYVYGLSCHVIGALRGEKAGDSYHVFDLGEPLEWDFGRELLDDLLHGHLEVPDISRRDVVPHAGVLRYPGADTVDIDGEAGQFIGERLGQTDYRRFCRRVVRHQRRAGLAGFRGEIDDLARAVLLHHGHDFFDEQESSLAVDREDSVPAFLVDFFDFALCDDACDVDENVDVAAKLVRGRLNDFHYLPVVRDVGGEAFAELAACIDIDAALVDCCLVQVGEEDFRTLLAETPRDAFSYGAGCAGNEGHLVLKFQFRSPWTGRVGLAPPLRLLKGGINNLALKLSDAAFLLIDAVEY